MAAAIWQDQARRTLSISPARSGGATIPPTDLGSGRLAGRGGQIPLARGACRHILTTTAAPA
jgi:hypothetical protein